jgi:hypothetical protein
MSSSGTLDRFGKFDWLGFRGPGLVKRLLCEHLLKWPLSGLPLLLLLVVASQLPAAHRRGHPRRRWLALL